MRSHEEKTARCHDYLTPQVNATHRKQMVEWYVDFADAFALSKETLGVAVSILDRYLSSGNENSHEALKSLQAFQRAAVTPFFNSLCAILRFFRWSRVRLFSNFPIQPSWGRSAAVVEAITFAAIDHRLYHGPESDVRSSSSTFDSLEGGIRRFDFLITTQVDNLLVISTAAADSLAVVVADLSTYQREISHENDSKHAW
jgi:hypothetical protein